LARRTLSLPRGKKRDLLLGAGVAAMGKPQKSFSSPETGNLEICLNHISASDWPSMTRRCIAACY
jgi:hypothetical protein